MSFPVPHTLGYLSLPVVQGGSTFSTQASTFHQTPLAWAAVDQGGEAGLMGPSEDFESFTSLHWNCLVCLYCRIPAMYEPDNYHLQSHAVPLHVTHLCLSARPPFWQQFLVVIKPTWTCTLWHRSNVITYSLKILELLAFGSCTNCLDGLNWAVSINENVDLSCIMLIYWF